MTTRTAIYARQSKDAENTEKAVTRQQEACESLARQRRWQVMDVLSDNDTSATNGAPQPAFDRLMAMMDGRAIDVILAAHPDRVVRRASRGRRPWC